MSSTGRRIVGYHSELRVRTRDGVKTIEATVGDWVSDEELLGLLGGCAETLGDLVEHLEAGDSPCEKCPGVLSCRIVKERGSGGPIHDGSRVLN